MYFGIGKKTVKAVNENVSTYTHEDQKKDFCGCIFCLLSMDFLNDKQTGGHTKLKEITCVYF